MSLSNRVMVVSVIVLMSVPLARAGKMSDQHRTWVEEDVRFLISSDEAKAFKDLKDDSERDRFIQIFWAQRDPTPLTPANELKDQYSERLTFVRSDGFPRSRGGSSSDMARVFLLLGQPSEQQRDDGVLIWVYQALPQFGTIHPVRFAFVDPEGAGYELLLDRTDGLELLASVPKSLVLHPELKDLPIYPHMMDQKMAAVIDELMKTGQARDEIACRIAPMYLKSEGGATYVSLVADFDADPGKSGKLAAFGRCAGPSGIREFNEPMEVAAAVDRPVAYTGFTLMPGKYDLFVGIMQKDSGKISVRKVEIDVPAFEAGELALSGIVASDRIEGAEAKLTSAPTSPFVFGHYRLAPKMTQIYKKDFSIFVFYNVYGYGIDDGVMKVTGEYVFNKDGQYFNRVPPDLTTQKVTENQAVVMGTEVPLATFPPGKYTVVVNLEDKITGAKVSRELAFEVK